LQSIERCEKGFKRIFENGDGEFRSSEQRETDLHINEQDDDHQCVPFDPVPDFFQRRIILHPGQVACNKKGKKHQSLFLAEKGQSEKYESQEIPDITFLR
jgi:hypothetical protein